MAKLHDERTILPQYLSSQDGKYTFDKQVQGHADMMGCECTNDKFAESVFGVFDRMLLRNSGISREGAAALTQALLDDSFIYSTHSLTLLIHSLTSIGDTCKVLCYGR